MFDFEYLTDRFLSLGAVLSVAQLQGMLCGKLSIGKNVAPDEWREEACKFLGLVATDMSEEILGLLDLILDISRKNFNSEYNTFQLLLPKDRASINRRVDELGAWCQGYLQGIGMVGLAADTQLNAEVVEILRDLAQIANVVIDDEADIEENEVYWSELVEYVRVAVLSVNSGFPLSRESGVSGEDPENIPLH